MAVYLLGTAAAAAQTNGRYFAPERHDIGAIGGAAFYAGDLKDNRTLFADPSVFIGLLYRHHFNEYFSLRGQVAAGTLQGRMRRPDLPPRNGDEYWPFNRSVLFMEMATETGFLPVNTVDFSKHRRWAPYLLGGAGFTVVSPDLDKWGKDADVRTTAGYLLLGMGVKYVLARRITVGVEWMARKTFNDGLDFAASPPGTWAINKDWIWTAGLSLTVRLREDRLCAAHRKFIPNNYKLEGIWKD